MLIAYSAKFGQQSSHLFGKELPALLVICSFCGCFIVFVCVFWLLCLRLDVDLIVLGHIFTFKHFIDLIQSSSIAYIPNKF